MSTPIILKLAHIPKKPACSVILGVSKIKVSKLTSTFFKELSAVLNSKKLGKWEMSMTVELLPDDGFEVGTMFSFAGIQNAVITKKTKHREDPSDVDRYTLMAEISFTSFVDDPFKIDPRDFIGQTAIESYEYIPEALIQRQ